MIEKERLHAFRRELHQFPELSTQEFQTQKRIQKILGEHSNLSGKTVGNTGLLYSFNFGSGPHVLMRVDTDALPIQEINNFEYKSTHPGVSHKCGHDGHTSIGVGLCALLSEAELTKGKVDVLFQPAEETGQGAEAVLADSNFDIKKYDYAIAMHNIPAYELGKVIVKNEEFTPAVHSIIVKIEGKTSHAAQPLKGDNPAYLMSQIILLAQEMEELDEKHENYGLITPVHEILGSPDYGISAGYGELHFTLRSWKQDNLEAQTEAFLKELKALNSENIFKIKIEKSAVFAANKNASRVVEAIAAAALKLNMEVEHKAEAFPWGEDFGLFTQHVDGAMFGLGAGINCPALHNPDYDFPDEITEPAVNLFYESICHLIYE